MKKAIVSGIFLSLTITLCCCRHSTTHNRDEYITDYTSFTDYEYIYDNNGLLKKVIERSDNIAFLSNDFIVSETVYFYDERDSIHKTEYYTYFSTKEYVLTEIVYFTDSTEIHVQVDETVMDTTYTVRFLPGNKEKPLEIFYQSKTHEIASELEHLLGAESLPPIRKKTFNRYDETGQLVESNEIDLFTDSKTQTKFRYETINDTLFTYTQQNDDLIFTTKNYTSLPYQIEVNYNPDMTYRDSTITTDYEKG